MALRDSQIGKEVWIRNPSSLRVTQVGKEVWENTNNTSLLRVTQIGKEVWITTGSVTPSNVFFFQPVMPPH